MLHRDLGQGAAEGVFLLAEDLPVLLGHDGIVAGVDVPQRALPVLVSRARDEEVPLVGGHLVHTLPAHGERAVRIARGHGLDRLPHGGTARGSPGLDPDIAQGVQAEPVVDHGLTEQLITEMVGEVPVIAGVNVAFQLGRGLVDESGRLGEGIDADLLGALVGHGPVELRLSRRHQVYRFCHFRNLQLFFTEPNH